jgi:multidrug efflux pump subunit AcrA (membrane-fusion protein)
MHTSTGGKMDHWLVDGDVAGLNRGLRRWTWRMVIARLDDSFLPVTVSLNGVEIYHLRSHSQLLADVRQAEIENRQFQAETAKAEELAAKRAVWKELDAAKPAEQKAEAALKLATSLLDAGRIEPARKRLQDVIDRFPGTRAAAQAADLLERHAAASTDD